MHAASVSRRGMRWWRRFTASSAAAIVASTPETSAVPQCWREVRARIDSRPVPRIRILSVAATTATGQPQEIHRPLPAELLVADAAHRLAMIAAARAPALGATNAWGHGLPLVKGSSCSSLLDRSQQRPACGARSSSRPRRDICTSWQWRPRQRLSTTRPWAPSPQWPPTREHSLHSTQPMAELSVVRQIDKQFEANGRGYPRP